MYSFKIKLLVLVFLHFLYMVNMKKGIKKYDTSNVNEKYYKRIKKTVLSLNLPHCN